MAQTILCATHPDRPAAYVITDQESFDTMAPCIECFIVFCQSVVAGVDAAQGEMSGAGAPVNEHAEARGPEPSDLSGGATDAYSVEPQDIGAGSKPKARKRAPAKAQETRTRRRLAARPDSAKSSAESVPFPGASNA
jgi:hypothetical protein